MQHSASVRRRRCRRGRVSRRRAPRRAWPLASAATGSSLDPGFGFGKTVEHNLALLRRLAEIAALGYPLLAGLSRKSTIGVLTGRDVDEQDGGQRCRGSGSGRARRAPLFAYTMCARPADALKVWRAVQPVTARPLMATTCYYLE